MPSFAPTAKGEAHRLGVVAPVVRALGVAARGGSVGQGGVGGPLRRRAGQLLVEQAIWNRDSARFLARRGTGGPSARGGPGTGRGGVRRGGFAGGDFGGGRMEREGRAVDAAGERASPAPAGRRPTSTSCARRAVQDRHVEVAVRRIAVSASAIAASATWTSTPWPLQGLRLGAGEPDQVVRLVVGDAPLTPSPPACPERGDLGAEPALQRCRTGPATNAIRTSATAMSSKTDCEGSTTGIGPGRPVAETYAAPGYLEHERRTTSRTQAPNATA